MPWKIIETMDQKIELISNWKTNKCCISELSRRYGISRPTVYKWIERYMLCGVDGLKEKSRKPNNSPKRTKEEVIELVIQEKLKNKNRGPKKVYAQLRRQYPRISFPVPSTIGEILKKEERSCKQKKAPYRCAGVYGTFQGLQ